MLESTVDVDCVGRDVSLHAVKEQASANAWGKIRPVLRRAVVESSAMPTIQLCIMCAETAVYRCSANAYYCHNCFNKAHCTIILEKFGRYL